MTKNFNCASCSAPLEFKGSPTQECDFCGGTVIAPAELFPTAGINPFGFSGTLSGTALNVAKIKKLTHTNKIEAIKLFRETFGVGLKEAKEAVDALERGETVGISGMQIRTSALDPKALETVKKIGYSIGGTVLAAIIISVVIVIMIIGGLVYSVVRTVETTAAGTGGSPATQQAQSATEDTTELLKFGGEGSGTGRFKDNRHVAIDGQGRIYSSDYSPHKIQVFDSTGKFITQWKPGKGANLYGLIADKAGNVFVANDKGVFKFAGETGEMLAAVEQISPRGVALTWEGKVIVTARKSLMIFDKDLKLVTDIKDAAERASSTFGFDAIAVDGEGSIFVFDRQNGDICRFSAEGKFLNRFPSGTVSAHALAIDPAGRIFLSNTSDILVFDASGRKLHEFDTFQAFGMAFDASGNLFIATRPHVTKLQLNF
jgi:DNA-binding beta-propeller fold protein YncE